MTEQDSNTTELSLATIYELMTTNEANAIYETLVRFKEPTALTKKGCIQTYKLVPETLYCNPLGGLGGRLIINDDPELHIAILLKQANGKLYNAAGGESQALRELLAARGGSHAKLY